MKTKKQAEWQEDEVMQDLHRVREKLGEELRKDPDAFYKRMDKHVRESGGKVANLKPHAPKPKRK